MATKVRVLVACLVLLLACAVPINAKVLDEAKLTVMVNVPQMLWVRVNVPQLVFEGDDFDTTKNAVMLEDGILATKPDAVQVEVGGNVGHVLFISLDDGLKGPNNAEIPSTQMGYRIATSHDDGTWFGMQPKTDTRRTLFQRATSGRTTFKMDFRLLATWQDAPGMYEGTIVYTVVPL
jgi:hypothetical protein